MKEHYPYDKSVVRRKTERNSKAELEQARRDGFFSYREFELVPLRDIEPEKVWDERKLEKIESGLSEGKTLPPIDLSETKGRYRYAINDGIHRYNASKRAGYTHVPAIITRHVDRPDLLEEPNLDYEAGDFVKFKKPFEGKWQYGYLAELIADRGWTKLFVVVGGDRSGSDWLGDLSVEYFEEKVDPPRQVQESILDNWYLKTSSSVAGRVATRAWRSLSR